MKKADIAIIGSGPAGISAAVTARQRNKSVFVFGSKELSAKIAKAEKIMNYTGLPEISGKDLSEALKKHLCVMGAEITEDKITAVYDMGVSFTLQGASGEMYEASAVIIASGVSASKPYKGESEFLGSGVSYCATCDAPLYKGRTVAVIADSPKEESEVRYLAEVCEKVLYFPLYKEKPNSDGNMTVYDEIPKEITANGISSRILVTDKGEHEAACVFILKQSISAAQLVPHIQTDGPSIVTDRLMQTNIKGCFACGDIAGRPYQYIKAAGEGNVAALSAVSYIDGLKK